MANKSPPFPAYPSWSTAKFFGFLRSALRSASSRYPPKYECLHEAKRKYSGENKRQKWEYQCAKCKGWFPQKNISVDHIVPVGTLRSLEDLPGFVERLFCAKEGFQVLCDGDHLEKTNEERRKAREEEGVHHRKPA